MGPYNGGRGDQTQMTKGSDFRGWTWRLGVESMARASWENKLDAPKGAGSGPSEEERGLTRFRRIW